MEKKLVTLVLACAMVFAPTCSISGIASETETGTEAKTEEINLEEIKFRDIDWNTSLDGVLDALITDDMIEGIHYDIGDDNTLIITGLNVSNYSAYTYINFDDDLRKFDCATYALTEEHTNLTDYYDDFCNLVELYTEKYGEPAEGGELWKDDYYKDKPEKWGMAIATGELVATYRWIALDESMVTIIISGDNYDISTCIFYESPDYESQDNMDGI